VIEREFQDAEGAEPYDFLMVTLALLFSPSTTPLENSFLALKYSSSSMRGARGSVRAIFFIGSSRLRMVMRAPEVQKHARPSGARCSSRIAESLL